MAAKQPEKREVREGETVVSLVSGVHGSVKVGAGICPPDGMTVVFVPVTGGFGIAEDVPEAVAEFLVSIAQKPGEYVIQDPASPPLGGMPPAKPEQGLPEKPSAPDRPDHELPETPEPKATSSMVLDEETAEEEEDEGEDKPATGRGRGRGRR